ncbi:MAG: iron-sulfur cluster assembly protein [Chloroherpetonaceae bacterium]|jgi:FeS assembly SUF system protein|nr:iron-sulfur cluster assembly protein [bacterium]
MENITIQDIQQKVIDVLKTVFDPEIPVNIYDLGLIYDIQVTEEDEVVVLMTLTAPTCPIAGNLPLEVEDAIRTIPEVTKAKVLLTFDPPWNPGMLSEEARLELGMF